MAGMQAPWGILSVVGMSAVRRLGSQWLELQLEGTHCLAGAHTLLWDLEVLVHTRLKRWAPCSQVLLLPESNAATSENYRRSLSMLNIGNKYPLFIAHALFALQRIVLATIVLFSIELQCCDCLEFTTVNFKVTMAENDVSPFTAKGKNKMSLWHCKGAFMAGTMQQFLLCLRRYHPRSLLCSSGQGRSGLSGPYSGPGVPPLWLLPFTQTCVKRMKTPQAKRHPTPLASITSLRGPCARGVEANLHEMITDPDVYKNCATGPHKNEKIYIFPQDVCSSHCTARS